MSYIQYPTREARKNYFPVPNQVMQLQLPWKELAVYLYLIHRYRYQYKTDFNYPRMVCDVFGFSDQMARKLLNDLYAKGLYSIVGSMIFPKHCFEKWEQWPEKFFPLPKELFALELSTGEIVLYAYLLYREKRDTFDCLVSRNQLQEVMGMSSNTVAKCVRSLEEKKFIETERTTYRRRNGEPMNGPLRFHILPIEGAKAKLCEMQIGDVCG